MLHKNFKMFFKDNFRIQIVTICILLAFFHGWQFFNSGYNVNCLVRLVFFLIIIPAVIFIRNTAIYFGLIIFSLVACYFISFNNYSAFFCILLSSRFYRKWERPLLMIYAINMGISLMMQHCAISHIFLHGLTCLLFYIIYFKINKNIISITLSLTEDEEYILQDMIDGKSLKEIDKFSKNTITKKIDQAIERNKCKSKLELAAKYVLQNYL